MTTRRTLPTSVVVTLALAGCGELAHDEEHEDAPAAEDVDLAMAGTIDCSREPGTGYSSGVLREIELVRVDGKLAKLETADAFWVMREAALREGVSIYVVSGFRTMEEQRYLYGCYVNCSCNNCNLAARPGYSNHQSGRALDLNTGDAGVLRWLNRNAERYGFERTVPSEDWHWELLGDAPARGPCLGGGAAALELVSPRSGATVENGAPFSIEPDARVHHVRWFADGYFIGVSEDAARGFPIRRVFNTLGARRIEAVGHDADDREVGRASTSVTIRASAAPLATLELRSPTDLGWFTNGLELTSHAGPGVSRVTYHAGPHELGSSGDATSGFRVRYTFRELGFRAIGAVAYGPRGEELAWASALVRVMPGSEGEAGPSVRFFARSGDTLENGGAILIGGSESVTRVVVEAIGAGGEGAAGEAASTRWPVGEATRTGAGFSVSRGFSQTGRRRLIATGYDAGGSAVATHEVTVIIR